MIEGDSEIKFWNLLDKLEVSLSKVIASEEKSEIAGIIKNDDRLNNLVREELGVIAGAFGVAHQTRDTFILLQNSILNHIVYDIPIIDVDYEIDGKSHSKLKHEEAFALHILWRGRRDQQRLLEQPPEFYIHLENVVSLSSFLQQLAYKILELDSFPNKFMLIIEEEILFFTYAWRWLIRCQQKHLDTNPIVNHRFVIDTVPNQQFLWDAPLWEKTDFEKEFIQTLNTGFNHAGDIYIMAKQGWDSITKRVGDQITENVTFEDWKSLGLINEEGEVTTALKSLLSYVNEVAKMLIIGKPPFSKNNYNELLSEIKNANTVIATKLNLLNEESKLDFGYDGKEIAIAIQTIIYSMLRGLLIDNKITSIENLLWTLHKTSRFPIIPSFYTVASIGHAVQHCFFSVWESQKFSVPIKYTSLSEDGTTSSNIIKSPIVVTSLLSLRPRWMLPEEIRANPEYFKLLLQKVQVFFRRLARPIIDRGFYGNLVTTHQHQEGRDEARRAFGHQIKTLSRALTDRWLCSADELFDFEFKHQDPESGSGKVGLLVLNDEYQWLKDKMAIAPFGELLHEVGHSLRLWSMTQSHDDLPLSINGKIPTVNLKAFLDGCLIFARKSLIPMAFTNEDKATVLTIQRLQVLTEEFEKLLEQQKIELTGEFSLFSDLGVKSHNSRDTIWLSRLFIVIFQNCIQHGNILKPIKVEVNSTKNSNTFEFTVVNDYGNRSNSQFWLDTLQNYYRTGILREDVSQDIIRSLVICLNDISVGGTVFDDPNSLAHSKTVILTCLEQLNGHLIQFPNKSGSNNYPAITKFKCSYELANINHAL